MKKSVLAMMCSAALVMAGCGTTAAVSSTASSSTDYSNQTITGKVTAIDGNSVTVQIGTMSEDQRGGEAPSGSAAPDGEAPSMPEGSAAPDGQNGGPGGAQQGGDHKQEDGTSGATSSADTETGATSSAAPDGQGGGMGGQTFTAGDATATFDLSSATITSTDTTDAKSVSDIAVDDVIILTVGDNNTVTAVAIQNVGGGMGGDQSFGGSGDVTQGTSANTITEDSTVTNQSYTSSGDDENALRIDGATVTLDGVTVSKTGGATSNTEDGDFYGMNAALLATNGAVVTAKNLTVTSDAQNGNGVFSYGEGTVVNISDSTITTSKDNSGGIQTTGGGTTNATNLTVTTSGNSAAAIRSDRGGGTVNVSEGTYTSSGYNSPGIYSTAAITASDATITANKSQALIIEGANSIDLTDCTVTGAMDAAQSTSADIGINNVMIYQSMSGDAEVGSSSFSMTGGTLTGNAGDMFFVTNTHTVMNLDGVSIVNNDSTGRLLVVTGNSASHGWGTAGSNGGQVDAVWNNETLSGDIAVDSISTLNLELANTTLTGTINIVDNEEGGTAVDNNAVITIDAGSTWNLTGNCKISSLFNNGTINFNGYSITLADGTVVTA